MNFIIYHFKKENQNLLFKSTYRIYYSCTYIYMCMYNIETICAHIFGNFVYIMRGFGNLSEFVPEMRLKQKCGGKNFKKHEH